jgi:hypothetical protein
MFGDGKRIAFRRFRQIAPGSWTQFELVPECLHPFPLVVGPYRANAA